MPFYDVHALTSGTCEYVILRGKMAFPDMVKVMDLENGGINLNYPAKPNLII